MSALTLHGKLARDTRSYPNSKKPIVATVDTVRASGRPVRPANLGGAIARNETKDWSRRVLRRRNGRFAWTPGLILPSKNSCQKRKESKRIQKEGSRKGREKSAYLYVHHPRRVHLNNALNHAGLPSMLPSTSSPTEPLLALRIRDRASIIQVKHIGRGPVPTDRRRIRDAADITYP